MIPIIEVRRLGKRFGLDHLREPYLSIRGRLSSIFSPSKRTEDFWALQDIDFDVNPGASVGIIGRNGAGKSTLLKILSRITPPTTGRAVLRGRVASLLEVGTGFHPELTGRENIDLHGSVLGMRRYEIQSKFDAIVDFAGTEKFLDTPLKYYSSGMQLRLAFSVAAFLEPEILIVDEVLAVGDAEFQRKCMGKMQEVADGGKTILFVSHNLAAVERLCTVGILLNDGRLIAHGAIESVVSAYSNHAGRPEQGRHISLKGSQLVKSVELLCDGKKDSAPYMGCQLSIRLYFDSKSELDFPVLGVLIKDEANTALVAVNNKHYVGNVAKSPVRRGILEASILKLPLFAGHYSVDLFLGNGFADLEILRDCIHFTVDAVPLTEKGSIPESRYNKVFLDQVEWKLTPWTSGGD